jgi:3-deoxy-manno-octulosonate cytidylyltransferase (CMP-KDO synthetase)
MIQCVVERACASGAAEVLVATDDERIAAVVRDPRRPGTRIAVLTDPALASGTAATRSVPGRRTVPAAGTH